jgi:hypothetical protein
MHQSPQVGSAHRQVPRCDCPARQRYRYAGSHVGQGMPDLLVGCLPAPQLQSECHVHDVSQICGYPSQLVAHALDVDHTETNHWKLSEDDVLDMHMAPAGTVRNSVPQC